MIEQVPSNRPQVRSLGQPSATSGRGPRWRVLVGLLIMLAISVLVWRNWTWLAGAIGLVRTANPLVLGAALLIILLSYLISSQVFQIGLRVLGQRIGPLRLLLTTITAIVISQLIPAGGVGSYVFFTSAFRRRGVAPGQAALLAALEALSYTGALLLLGTCSLVYLALMTFGSAGATLSMAGPIGAAVLAGVVLGGIGYAFTCSESTLTRWALALSRVIHSVLRQPHTEDQARGIVGELVRGREMIAMHRPLALTVICIQLVALCGHSLALLLVLWSLHVNVGFTVVLAAFGGALMTSTFNVLPGGGGTVEAVLVIILLRFGVGTAAVPAAILFRLLNFWAILPLAAGYYVWQAREPRPVDQDEDATRQTAGSGRRRGVKRGTL